MLRTRASHGIPSFFGRASRCKTRWRPTGLCTALRMPAARAHSTTATRGRLRRGGTLDQVEGRAIAAGVPRIVTDYATAELVKVAANAFLATKISFINAMSEIADVVGA